jgi:hypothetical protein
MTKALTLKPIIATIAHILNWKINKNMRSTKLKSIKCEKLTYGEAHVFVQRNMHMINGVWTALPLPAHFERMNKKEAGEYYTRKINEYFKKRNQS